MVAILQVLCTLLVVTAQAPLYATTAPRALPLYMPSKPATPYDHLFQYWFYHQTMFWPVFDPVFHTPSA